jgi:signal transduction histidine kinase
MMHMPQRGLAAALLVLTAAALAAGAGLGIAAGTPAAAVQFVPVLLAFAAVGWFVARHRPRNPIGWLFLAEALAFAVAVATSNYAKYGVSADSQLPGVAWLAWLGAIPGELFFIFALVLLVFPDGRLPSPRWRPVAWVIIAAEMVTVAIATLSGAALRSQGSAVKSPVNLIPAGAAFSILQFVQTVMIPVSVVAAAGCVSRYRRSSVEVRHQIRWFAFAGLLTAASMLVFGVAVNNPLIGFVALGPLVPIATGIAITKYRLYDIDIVLRRTIVYAAMAAFITAVYVAIVVGIGALSSGTLAPSGAQPSLALSVVATAVVGVAFQPVRERVQRLASRLVYGHRATPYQALSEFAGRMSESYAYDEVLPRMARILAEGTGADRADVWLAADSALRSGASWPSQAEERETVPLPADGMPAIGGATRVLMVQHDGETLGALSVSKRAGEALTPTEDKLLSDLAAQAGLILRNVGLTEELMARVTELHASRLRIVEAQDSERLRIQRDLRAGTQQQLVDISAKLAVAESIAGQDDLQEREVIGQLRAETRKAMETLRELAHGINPPVLAQSGLAAAIGSLASRSVPPAQLIASGLARYPEEVETAIYFCCTEILQNAARQAPGSTVRLRVAEADGVLALSAACDGPGLDNLAAGGGSSLQNMTDRIAALGGTLGLSTEPDGTGATITCQIGVEAPDSVAPGSASAADGESAPAALGSVMHTLPLIIARSAAGQVPR